VPFVTLCIRTEPFYRRAAFEAGFRRLGYEIRDGLREQHHHSFNGGIPDSRDDILCLWNLKHGPAEDAAKKFEDAGGTVLVVENGYLQREDKTQYAISVHAHNGDGWYPIRAEEDRFSRLGFRVQPWRLSGNHILVCGQRGVGSERMRSPDGWESTTVEKLQRKFPDREIRFRPHPGNFAPRVPLERDLAGAHACVIWSSASGVRALVEGVPVFYNAPSWICQDASCAVRYFHRDFMVPDYSLVHVEGVLNHMAHGQWTPDEIATGEPIARMRDLNWGEEQWRL